MIVEMACPKNRQRMAHRMFEHSEAHLVDLKDMWVDLSAVTRNASLSFDFSEADSEYIKLDGVSGADIFTEVRVHQAQAIQRLQSYPR